MFTGGSRYRELVLVVLVGLGSALVYGAADFFGGQASKRVSPVRVVSLSAIVGLVLLAVFNLFLGGRMSDEALLWGGLSGIAGSMAILTLYAALAIGPMSILSPLTAVISAIVPLSWGLILGERLSLLGYIALGHRARRRGARRVRAREGRGASEIAGRRLRDRVGRADRRVPDPGRPGSRRLRIAPAGVQPRDVPGRAVVDHPGAVRGRPHPALAAGTVGGAGALADRRRGHGRFGGQHAAADRVPHRRPQRRGGADGVVPGGHHRARRDRAQGADRAGAVGRAGARADRRGHAGGRLTAASASLRLASRQLREDRLAGGDRDPLRRDVGAGEQLLGAAAAVARHERDDEALLAGAAGAAGAVQVRLVLVGRVGLDHQGDVVDVDAAGGDVGRDQRADAAARELLERAGAARLVQVAVDALGADARVVEHVGEHLGERAGAREHELLAGTGRELDQHLLLVALIHEQHDVLDRRAVLVLAGDLEDRRVDEVLLDDVGDTAVERRREQQLLAAVLGVVQDVLHRLEEAQLRHVVGLVEHGDDHLREVELALVDQVLDATGRADDDVDAALEGAELTGVRDAAVDLRREEADAARDRLHGAVDLQGQLAGRGQDEGLRCAAELASLVGRLVGAQLEQALDERCSERDGLAGAGAAAAEHVAAGEHVGDRRGLDRERRLGTELGQHADDVVAEAEVAEADAVDVGRLDGLRLEALEHDVVAVHERGATGAVVVVAGGAVVVAARRALDVVLGALAQLARRALGVVVATGRSVRGRLVVAGACGRSSWCAGRSVASVVASARGGRRCAPGGCPSRAAPSSGGRRRRACCRRIRRRASVRAGRS